MKKFMQSLALSVMALATAMTGAPALAAETGITNGTNNVVVRREVADSVNPVSATFTYSMTADESNPAEIGGLANFSLQLSGVASNGGVSVGEKVVNLSDLSFTKVGDYRIIIREVGSSNEQNFPVDNENYYVVFVEVRNEMDGSRPTGNLVASVADQVADSYGEKRDKAVFWSTARRTHIELSKTVAGDNADLDKYFKFRIDFRNASQGDVFSITGQDEVVEYNGQSIRTQTQYVVGEENYVYLKAGQTVVVGENGQNELPIGLEYTITELDAGDYETYIDGGADDGKVSRRKLTLSEYGPNNNGMLFAEENITNFENVKNGAVLTGVSTAVLPFVGIVLLGVTAVFVYRAVSRKKN